MVGRVWRGAPLTLTLRHTKPAQHMFQLKLPSPFPPSLQFQHSINDLPTPSGAPPNTRIPPPIQHRAVWSPPCRSAHLHPPHPQGTLPVAWVAPPLYASPTPCAERPLQRQLWVHHAAAPIQPRSSQAAQRLSQQVPPDRPTEAA